MRVDLIGHPFVEKPELAVDIIALKSACAKYERKIREATENDPEGPHWTLIDSLCYTKREMIKLLDKYKDEVRWCPYCNSHKEINYDARMEDPFPDADNFGSICTHVKIFNSYEGWECKVCGRSTTEKIEHWN